MKTISPSGLKTWDLCPVKWYYTYVAKLPRKPPMRGAELGSKMHAQIEHYLKTGEDVREFLPQLSAAALREYEDENKRIGGRRVIEDWMDPQITTPGGVAIVGKADAIFELANSRAVIVDHKFRSDVSKWAETSEELPDDPQAILYSAWVATTWGVETVDFVHHNHNTKGKAYFLPVKISLTRDDVLVRFMRLSKQIDGIAACAGGNFDTFKPKSPDACGAFGGCDFLAVCPYAPGASDRTMLSNIIQSTKTGENKMGILQISDNDLESVLPPDAPTENVAEPAPAPVAVPTAPEKPSNKNKKTKQAPPEPDATLLVVDAFCSRATDLNPWVMGIANDMAEKVGCPDIRIAPKDTPYGFGGWKTHLALEVKARFPELGKGIYSIRTTDLTEPVIDVLSSLSLVVVRGGLR